MADSQQPAAPAVNQPEGDKGPSKKALKKAEKDKKKAEFKAANAAKRETTQTASKAEEEKSDNFGVLPLNQSQERPKRNFANVKDLDTPKVGQTVLVRGRIHTSRQKGNLVFLTIRQRLYTIQAVVAKGANISKAMINFVSGINKESIVDVEGTLVAPNEPVVLTSQQNVEIAVQKVHVVSAAAAPLPVQLEDLARPSSVYKAQKAEIKLLETQIAAVEAKLAGLDPAKEENAGAFAELKDLQKKRSEAQKYVKVERETRLNNRIIDLRTPANQAIFRIQSAIGQLFREFLLQNEFTEIHSPKILGAASEGGAEVFKVKYFEGWAYLAQSPQFYKQMAIASDMERVFEIAPVFRAENSFTHRHMTEFMGLDLEMSFYEHYHEVLDVLDGLFCYIFDGITQRFAKELEIISQQYPFEPLKYNKPSLRLDWKEAIALFREAEPNHGDLEDFNTTQEKHLGKLVKQKYGVDFYIIDRFPTHIRPFYTMKSPDDANYSNSYDFFLRGEEIMSGAQRVHDPATLAERAKEKGVPVEGIKDYIDSFKYGAAPHAGGGIGLERVVMLYLGLKNIRQTSMFPRDPKRTTP